jgi:hypothetical protein
MHRSIVGLALIALTAAACSFKSETVERPPAAATVTTPVPATTSTTYATPSGTTTVTTPAPATATTVYRR